ncbi:MAG: flagellar hook-length control protein FliK [Gammaproteobacteria bacterium]|nr:flagellar hook-length control protein FliK [Gammaproteobacteria bacterium]
MTDVMLPQVSPPQVTAKPDRAVAKSPELAQKSESNQDFSKMLKDRMQPEKSGEAKANDKPKTTEPTESRSGEAVPVEIADGKQLPASGNAEDNLVATLTPEAPAQDLPIVQASEPAPTAPALASEDSQDNGVVADQTSVATVVPLAVITTVSEKSLRPVSPAGEHTTPVPPGPLTTAVKTTLPEPAHTAVAHAVRTAIAELDAAALTQQTQLRMGAEVRAMAVAQQRGQGFEALMDRTAPVQQSQSTSALPQGLQGLLAQDASATAAARPVLPTTTLQTPFRQPGWDQALSERVMWAASQKLQSAEIKLNPPHLGPIEVRVQMHQDQAQVSFTAQHAVVREALEASMPRLRDMFNASGFNLLDVNVSQHSFAEQQRHTQGFATVSRTRQADEDGATISGASPVEISRVGEMSRSGIDLFA